MAATPSGQPDRGSQRRRAVRRVFAITLVFNLITAGSKLGWGLWSNSLSMTADGFHSFLDSASNVVGIVALSISVQPPDSDHPYGHRKFEALAAIVISFFLFSTSFKVLEQAIGRLLAEERTIPTVSAISYAIVGANLVISFCVARYEGRKGRELGNELLLADARHTQSDVFTSVSVLAALISAEFEVWALDIVAALVIVGLIFHAGYQIILTHLGTLVDAAMLDAEHVRALVAQVPGVVTCDGVRSRGHTDHVFIDLRIQVNPTLTVEEGHTIAHQVEDRLRARFPDRIAEVLVHVEAAETAAP